MKWRDTTGYSKGGPKEPTTWTTNIGRLRLTVTSSHVYYPGQWVFYCEPFYNTHKLGYGSMEEAQAKALQLVREEVAKTAADMEATRGD